MARLPPTPLRTHSTKSKSISSLSSLFESSNLTPNSPGSGGHSPTVSFGGGNRGSVSWGGGGAAGYEEVQNRTFVKWVNARLEHLGTPPLTDLGKDFSDGVMLILLVETLTQTPLGSYNRANNMMKVQKYENVNKALERVREMGVVLTNIGAEDVVEGNLKLILGLIWSLVLRYSIADISEGGSKAKDGLLLWCQRVTAPYSEDVSVENFTRSWVDGLAFCALIHSHRPDLIDFNSLDKDPSAAPHNMRLALEVAAKELNIPQLFDVEDIVGARKADERSIMTYVASIFHRFSAEARTSSEAKTLTAFAELLGSLLIGIQEYEPMAQRFMDSTSTLLSTWLNSALPSTYPLLLQSESELKHYQTSEKRERIQELNKCRELLFNVQTKLKTYGLRGYEPPEGLRGEDLAKRWGQVLIEEGNRSRDIAGGIFEIQERSRLRFAELANSFHDKLEAISRSFSESSEEALEDQQSTISTLLSDLAKLEASTQNIESAEKDFLEFEATRNERTVHTLESLRFELHLLQKAVQTRSRFVDNQLVARAKTEIKPEQLEAYEVAFRAFDKEERNVLDPEEFAAALSSLGISEISLDDVHRGEDDTVDFNSFTRFLVERGEDRLTASKVWSAFRGVAEDKNYLTEVDLQRVLLPPNVIDAILDRMDAARCEKEEGKWDYEEFLEGLFA